MRLCIWKFSTLEAQQTGSNLSAFWGNWTEQPTNSDSFNYMWQTRPRFLDVEHCMVFSVFIISPGHGEQSNRSDFLVAFIFGAAVETTTHVDKSQAWGLVHWSLMCIWIWKDWNNFSNQFPIVSGRFPSDRLIMRIEYLKRFVRIFSSRGMESSYKRKLIKKTIDC